jgi:hypothetical protein
LSTAALAIDVAATAGRFAIDVVAIFLLAVVLSYRRHRRRDLVALYVIFNVGLFAAVVVIAGGEVAAAVGFGLFAVLSIIRLRAETLTNAEIAGFFAAIVLGLVTGIDLGGAGLNAGLAAIVLLAVAIADHPGLLAEHRRVDVTLDVAIADHAQLVREVERRLGVEVIAVELAEVDYVRETTSVAARVVDRPAVAAGAGMGAVG